MSWSTEFIKAFNGAAKQAHATSVRNGFDKNRNIPESLALIHSEVSEALEADRKDMGESKKLFGVSQFTEELADIVIRVMDLAEAEGCYLSGAIVRKMQYNESREHLHGNKY